MAKGKSDNGRLSAGQLIVKKNPLGLLQAKSKFVGLVGGSR